MTSRWRRTMLELVILKRLDIGIFPRAQSGDHFVPEDAGFHHIALVGGCYLVATLSRELESNAPDPFTLIGDAAGQFANDHEIEPIDEFSAGFLQTSRLRFGGTLCLRDLYASDPWRANHRYTRI